MIKSPLSGVNGMSNTRRIKHCNTYADQQQSSWSIISFLKKLSSAGQAILCTIHQPSAILFQEFDRLLFLAKGGKTVYFGEVGENSQTLLNYFENQGARKCGKDENPAEYMLEIVNKGKNDEGRDWFDVWKGSENAKEVQRQIDQLHEEKKHEELNIAAETGGSEFAMPLTNQIYECTYRCFQQYWRMPSYVMAKFGLCAIASIFIGFSFYQANSTLAGMQTIVFSVFMMTTIFSSLVQQVYPPATIKRYSFFILTIYRFNLCSSHNDLCTKFASDPVKRIRGRPS